MAERVEEPEGLADQGAEPISPAAAIAIGMRRRRSRDKADPELDIFLREQTQLVRLQKEHLHEQREVQLSHLKLSRFNELMKAALQVMTALVGLAVVSVVAVMAWQAYEDHGVVIEAFSVPPDLAARGLTGQVAASQLLDRLAQLQQQTVTSRPASTYANDWGRDIKVEIPEAGVSIGELNRWLRQWLGSETRISGEIVRTPAGLAVTARSGDAPGRRFEGAEADIDRLIGQAAEAVYQQTQPYRWAVYLASTGQDDKAAAAYASIAKSGSSADRAWAYAGWSALRARQFRATEAKRLAEAAIAENPNLYPPYTILGEVLEELGLEEVKLAMNRRQLALARSGRALGLPDKDRTAQIWFLEGVDARLTGDLGKAAADFAHVGDFAGEARRWSQRDFEGESLAAVHDVSGSRRVYSYTLLQVPSTTPIERMEALDDWAGLARLFSSLPRRDLGEVAATDAAPWSAQVFAHVGRLNDAEAAIAESPPDCYRCLMTRGLIAALGRDWPAADHWYAEAARQAPSLPFAHTDWGQALLWKGDLDVAIAKLAEAHRCGPHYADPLELWGEALMRKGDFLGASDKFAEAAKYAPRWGRNHLRWGQAQMLLGRYGEARKQYEAARGMDLSKPDRAALNVLLARTASGPLHG
jgi:tetratricopeptide (TPR) repeat protein